MSTPTLRATFVAFAILASVGVTVFTAMLVWPHYQEYRAVQSLIEVLPRDIEPDPFEERLDSVKSFNQGRAAIEPLIRQFTSEDKNTVWRAEVALALIGAPASDALINRLVDTDESIDIRTSAARSLGIMRYRPAAQSLMAMLDDEHPKVRCSSAWALFFLAPDSEPAIPRLTELLDDAHDLTRRWAIFALSALGPKAKEAVPALIRALGDRDGDTRALAASALGGVGVDARPAIPALIAAIRDAEAQDAAATSIGKIGVDDESLIHQITELLDDSDPDVRLYAVIALGEIGPNAVLAVPRLLKLQERDSEWRWIITKAIGQIRGTDDLDR